MIRAALPEIIATATDDGRHPARVHIIHLTVDALIDIALTYKWAGFERARCLILGSALVDSALFDSEWQIVLRKPLTVSASGLVVPCQYLDL